LNLINRAFSILINNLRAAVDAVFNSYGAGIFVLHFIDSNRCYTREIIFP